MAKLITIINGPNLNLVGVREPEIYGHETIEDARRQCAEILEPAGFELNSLQSNHEGEMVDWIHTAREESAGIIINPAAYSHTSIALFDALSAFNGPVLEVHISNIHKREKFRHHSYVSMRAEGVIAGFGIEGYSLAARRMVSLLSA